MNKIKWIIASVVAASLLLIFSGGHSDSYIRDRVLMLTGDAGGQCTGEQVRAPSGKDYILTAAHCLPLANGEGRINAKTERGAIFSVGVIAEDPTADLLLLEGIPHLRGLDVASGDHKYEWIRTFTHGRGMDTYETSGPIVMYKIEQVPIDLVISKEEAAACRSMPKYKIIEMPIIFGIMMPVCALEEEFMVSTAWVVPGSSGGPAVDRAGDLVGVVSAGGEGFGLFVMSRDISAFLKDF